ncbi:MAG: OmpA family protein [Rhodospirillales bacterium]|jgi:outer membrane protein OmpA-like peptidoglycan-associated protein|nr:OmpA family protein [Rhodospirillales bacterium]MDP7216219.1 OmpA family protein [Rhodospirillales bacterium]HIJ42986.1 OmpA family protein [Rhodospirillaceae bacterium]HIJ92174.1 OmpA family protein [Rhodospirillaceae bacterium]HJP53570.1 OmpA family protein [Rhodospirillales bacterium]
MVTEENRQFTFKRFSGPVFLGLLLPALMLMSGCSDIPDAANPVEWYKSTVGLFTGEDKEVRTAKETGKQQSSLVADRNKPPPGADKPFPKLSSVPARPSRGLVGDTERRRYAKPIPRQSEPAQSLGSEVTAMAVPPAPPPAAVPTTPVAAVPTIPVAPAPIAPFSVPPPFVAASSAAAPPSTVRKTYEDRLARRLPEKSEPMTLAEGMPGLPQLSPGPQRFATVVISSSGVELAAASPGMALSRPTPAPTPAASPAGRPELVPSKKPIAAKGGFKVATIQFPNGSFDINAQDQRILDNVSVIFRQRGGELRVVGHASSRTRSMDPVEHKMVNFQISAARANTIASELIRLGVPASQIRVVAMSDVKPLYFEFMPSGEAGNRRAEIYIVN